MDKAPHITEILRLKNGILDDTSEKMAQITGKKNLIQEIEMEIHSKVEKALKDLGLDNSATSAEVFDSLLSRISRMEGRISEITFHPRFDTPEGNKTLINMISELVGEKRGLFLKKEKAEELLKKNPPKNIMKALGYTSIDKMLAQEDLWEVFSALRFVEDMNWLNTVFFKPYETLTVDDFEERPIRVQVLHPKWTEVGSEFVGHKLHNLSHLKEMGLIFVIPYKKQKLGQIIQVITLALHYFNEIEFYSNLFREFAKTDNFTGHLTSALRGDIIEPPVSKEGTIIWGIVQRYLAKDDANDPRLFKPHVNPEAIHWLKGENDFQRWAERFEVYDVKFWDGMDYVGDFFQKEKNGENELVSFDLVDNVVSFVRKTEFSLKYLYHQQEALWNEIFVRYMGREEMEKMIIKNFTKGYIELK